MATKTLIEKIEALPPEKRAELEDFVDAIASRDRSAGEDRPQMPTLSQELLDRIDGRRERLRRAHGLFDSVPIIRELRENGV